MRKQTILYYSRPSRLLDAVIDRSAGELATLFEATLARAGDGFERIEAIVRSTCRLPSAVPSCSVSCREVSRLGPPAAMRLTEKISTSCSAPARSSTPR